MQGARLWFGCLVLSLVPALAWGQSPAYKAIITSVEVEIRSGPGSDFPITGRLLRGQEVTVESDANGWLAIVPPPGSKSYINDRFLQFPVLPPGAPPIAIVLGDQVPVRPADDKGMTPLPVERVRLPRGTQVLLSGSKVSSDGSTWWPIQPTARDVRYIPNSAIVPPAVASAGMPGTASFSPAGEPALWRQAIEAERAGNFGTARDLYARMADDARGVGGDRDLAARCYDRIQLIEDRMRVASAPMSATAVSASRPADAVVTSSPNRLLPPAVTPSAPPAPLTPPSSMPPVLSIQTAPQAQTGTIAGWLRRTGFRIDGRPTYALENSQGAFLRWYVTPQPNVNLEPFVNRAVELSGPLIYRGDIRSNYMVVNQVTLLR
jgi:hypothetical protein